MSYHLVSTSHFMFWSIAQLFLILHVCLGREGTIEESIRTKRVISYLKNPKSGEGRSDFSKKIVETFHRIVKKILPKNDTTDYTDSKTPRLALSAQKRPNPSKSFDDYDVEDGVLSESGGYSVKVLDPSKSSSSNADESYYDGADDMLIERPIVRKRVSKRSSPEEDSTITPNNSDEDYYRRVRNVWKRVEEIISEKKIRKSTLLDSLKRRIRRKRKWIDDSDDDDDEETQIESGVGLGLEEDNVRLLSLLPLLPDSSDYDDENDDALHLLFLCIFGAMSLLGMAILIMGIYSAALTHVRGGADVSPEPMENFKRTCLGIIGKIPGFGSSEGSAPPEEIYSKKGGSEGSSSGPKRNPEDVDFLLRRFVKALDQRPSRSLNQKYGSKTHLKNVRRIIRKER